MSETGKRFSTAGKYVEDFQKLIDTFAIIFRSFNISKKDRILNQSNFMSIFYPIWTILTLCYLFVTGKLSVQRLG